MMVAYKRARMLHPLQSQHTQESRGLRRAPPSFIRAFLFVALLGSACALLGQTIGPDEIQVSGRDYRPQRQNAIRVETRLVDVEVVVRDVRGIPLPGLTQADFHIFDEGKERAITSFAVQTFSPVARAPAESTQSSAAPNAVAATVKDVPPPRYIVLYFDDVDHGVTNLAMGDIAHARNAAARFVKEALAPSDHVAIVTSTSTQNRDFTTSVADLLTAIAKLQMHPRVALNGSVSCPRISPFQAYLIANNLDPSALNSAREEANKCDMTISTMGAGAPGSTQPQQGAAFTFDPILAQIRAQAQQTWEQARFVSASTLDKVREAVNSLAKMPGTRMLLISSSGFLTGTLERDEEAIVNDALRANVVINALDAKGLYSEDSSRPIEEGNDASFVPPGVVMFQVQSLGERLLSADGAMTDFAQSTGGLFFHDNNDLNLGFYKLGVIPSVTYLLGFSPEGIPQDGKYHKLTVRLAAGKGKYIESRPGYFAPLKPASAPQRAQGAPPQPSPRELLDQEVLADYAVHDVAETVSAQPGTSAAGAPVLWITVDVDLKALSFQTKNDRSVQALTFVLALFDDHENFVTGKEGEMDLALKDSTLARFSQKGINAKFFLEAPRGKYKLRVVTQEGLTGKMSSSSSAVDMP